MKMKEKNKEITKSKLIVDEKLFKGFTEENFSCVRDICYKINDKLYKKYTKYCDNIEDDPDTDHKKFATCDKCWITFLTENLIKIQENNMQKNGIPVIIHY